MLSMIKLYIFLIISGLALLILLLQTREDFGASTTLRAEHFGRIKGWYESSRQTTLYIKPNEDTSILIPPKFCNDTTSVLIMVLSQPSHHLQRTAIRETWGGKKKIRNYIFQTYYLMGRTSNQTLQKELDQEFQEFDDIIQEDFVDSYNNLTIKSVMMLKLVTRRCANVVQYVMKSDDDVYIHYPPLVDLLEMSHQKTKVLLGSLIQNATPLRDVVNKWFAPYYLYKKKTYPNYLSGAAYIMSVDVVINLYSASLKIPLYHMEDIYLTGILAEEIQVEPHENLGFTGNKRFMKLPCLYKYAINTHYTSPDEIGVIHRNILRTDFSKCKIPRGDIYKYMLTDKYFDKSIPKPVVKPPPAESNI